MVVETAVVRSTLSATGGTADFTSSGFGTPTGAIIVACGGNTTANPSDDAIWGIGFWDGTTQLAMGNIAGHGLTTTKARRAQSNLRGVMLPTVTVGTNDEHTVSNITDGIRLTHSVDNTTVARYATVILIKGVTVKATDTLSNGTVDTATTSASVGFEPTGGIFSSIGAPNQPQHTAASALSIGVAIKRGNKQYTIGQFDRQNVTTTERTSGYFTNRCGVVRAPGFTNGTHNVELTDWGTDTFDLTTRDGTPTAPQHVHGLIFADNALDAFAADTPTSTGTVGHTLGVQVSALLLAGQLNNTTSDTTSDSEGFSVGLSDGTNDFCHSIESEDGAATSSCGSEAYTDRILDINNAEVSGGKTTRVQATVDGFSGRVATLDYSVVDTSARGIIGIAIGASTGGTFRRIAGRGLLG